MNNHILSPKNALFDVWLKLVVSLLFKNYMHYLPLLEWGVALYSNSLYISKMLCAKFAYIHSKFLYQSPLESGCAIHSKEWNFLIQGYIYAPRLTEISQWFWKRKFLVEWQCVVIYLFLRWSDTWPFILIIPLPIGYAFFLSYKYMHIKLYIDMIKGIFL